MDIFWIGHVLLWACFFLMCASMAMLCAHVLALACFVIGMCYVKARACADVGMIWHRDVQITACASIPICCCDDMLMSELLWACADMGMCRDGHALICV